MKTTLNISNFVSWSVGTVLVATQAIFGAFILLPYMLDALTSGDSHAWGALTITALLLAMRLAFCMIFFLSRVERGYTQSFAHVSVALMVCVASIILEASLSTSENYVAIEWLVEIVVIRLCFYFTICLFALAAAVFAIIDGDQKEADNEKV